MGGGILFKVGELSGRLTGITAKHVDVLHITGHFRETDRQSDGWTGRETLTDLFISNSFHHRKYKTSLKRVHYIRTISGIEFGCL